MYHKTQFTLFQRASPSKSGEALFKEAKQRIKTKRKAILQKIWLEHYPDTIPHEIDPQHYHSLVDMFENAVNKFADQPAFINHGQVITFRKLEQKSRAFAAYLQKLGLKQGDRIALMMPNLLQYPIAFFGALRAGLIIINVNPLYTARELSHQLCDSSAKAIVIVSNFAHTLEEVVKETAIEHVILTSIGDQLSYTKRPIVNFVVKYIKRLIPKYTLPGAISFRTVLKQGKTLQYVKPFIKANDIALLQYTGGTTGLSKGAMLSHQNILANIAQAKAFYLPALEVGRELIVTALPLYHIFALTVNLLLFFDIGGRNLLITNPRDIKGLIKELSHYPFSLLTGVNTLFNALLNNEDFKELDFSHHHLTIGGGMAVQKSVAETWQRVTGTQLLEGYGLTECSPLVAANPYNTEAYNGTIGFPVPSTAIRIVDEQDNDVPIGQPGELLVKGPQVMSGYWQRPEATLEVLKAGWLRTGDIVQSDERGVLSIIDRKKDMILVSGFNVYPNEIEEVIMKCEQVLEVAVVGVPHDASGEQVKAYVVKKDQQLTKEILLQHCRANLTGYKVPKYIEFKDELPKSNVGKILRRELKNGR